MNTCRNCSIEIKHKGYCPECRKVMRKGHYQAYKEKHITKTEKVCAKENCRSTFVSTNGKKYCLEHR